MVSIPVPPIRREPTPPPPPPQQQVVQLPPWVPHVQAYLDQPAYTQRLHREIADFVAFVRPSEERRAQQLQLVERLRAIAVPLWENSRLEPFGSMTTGLNLTCSDVDLVWVGDLSQSSHDAVHYLHKLAKAVRAAGMTTTTNVLASARIPLLKFVDVQTGVDVDICINQHAALAAVDYVNSAKARYPHMEQLVLVLKCYLRCRTLHETYTGGVGSFLLQLMVIGFLQLHEPRPSTPPEPSPTNSASSDSKNRDSSPVPSPTGSPEPSPTHAGNRSPCLGQLLLSFFDFYANHFHLHRFGISVRSGILFDKADHGWLQPDNPALLCMENPTNAQHDVGRGAFRILQVLHEFRTSLHVILAAGARPPVPTLLGLVLREPPANS